MVSTRRPILYLFDILKQPTGSSVGATQVDPLKGRTASLFRYLVLTPYFLLRNKDLHSYVEKRTSKDEVFPVVPEDGKHERYRVDKMHGRITNKGRVDPDNSYMKRFISQRSGDKTLGEAIYLEKVPNEGDSKYFVVEWGKIFNAFDIDVVRFDECLLNADNCSGIDLCKVLNLAVSYYDQGFILGNFRKKDDSVSEDLVEWEAALHGYYQYKYLAILKRLRDTLMVVSEEYHAQQPGHDLKKMVADACDILYQCSYKEEPLKKEEQAFLHSTINELDPDLIKRYRIEEERYHVLRQRQLARYQHFVEAVLDQLANDPVQYGGDGVQNFARMMEREDIVPEECANFIVESAGSQGAREWAQLLSRLLEKEGLLSTPIHTESPEELSAAISNDSKRHIANEIARKITDDWDNRPSGEQNPVRLTLLMLDWIESKDQSVQQDLNRVRAEIETKQNDILTQQRSKRAKIKTFLRSLMRLPLLIKVLVLFLGVILIGFFVIRGRESVKMNWGDSDPLLETSKIGASYKKDAVDLCRHHDWIKAAKKYDDAFQSDNSDVESLICKHNALTMSWGPLDCTVAVPVPLKKSKQATDVLIGIALYQSCLRETDPHIRVLIVDDNEQDSDDIQKWADQYPQAIINYGIKSDGTSINDADVVAAVIGHFDSSHTLAACKKYTGKGLVCISPTSTSTDLTDPSTNSDLSGYFYRTATSDELNMEKLVQITLEKLKALAKQQPNNWLPSTNHWITIAYRDGSNYSMSCRESYIKALEKARDHSWDASKYGPLKFDRNDPNCNITLDSAAQYQQHISRISGSASSDKFAHATHPLVHQAQTDVLAVLPDLGSHDDALNMLIWAGQIQVRVTNDSMDADDKNAVSGNASISAIDAVLPYCPRPPDNDDPKKTDANVVLLMKQYTQDLFKNKQSSQNQSKLANWRINTSYAALQVISERVKEIKKEHNRHVNRDSIQQVLSNSPLFNLGNPTKELSIPKHAYMDSTTLFYWHD